MYWSKNFEFIMHSNARFTSFSDFGALPLWLCLGATVTLPYRDRFINSLEKARSMKLSLKFELENEYYSLEALYIDVHSLITVTAHISAVHSRGLKDRVLIEITLQREETPSS
jgi:hypothetical protein